MFALYDTKANVYDTPVFLMNEVHAKRWFFTMIQRGEGKFEYFKDEIELHELATFDVLTGKITAKKTILQEGKQIRKEIENNENSDAA